MSKTASQIISENYEKIIRAKYPHLADRWPIISGYNIINGQYKDFIIVIFKDTGIRGIISSDTVDFNADYLGVLDINNDNIELVKQKLAKDYGLSARDSIAILKIDASNLDSELLTLFQKHEVNGGYSYENIS